MENQKSVYLRNIRFSASLCISYPSPHHRGLADSGSWLSFSTCELLITTINAVNRSMNFIFRQHNHSFEVVLRSSCLLEQ